MRTLALVLALSTLAACAGAETQVRAPQRAAFSVDALVARMSQVQQMASAPPGAVIVA